MGKDHTRSGDHDGASPGKIFIGGLPRDTTTATFLKHFGKYGEIIDSVIMKDKHTSQPRGFGFITYADPSVVDKVIEDSHVINGKQVEIKRTIPKGATQSKDFKTKKIFVGGIPSTLTEDDFKNFFAKYGTVVDHQIIRDHETQRSRGFGFIIFDSEQVVDDLLAKGNMTDLAGSKVEIKKAEPKKSSSNPRPPSYGSDSRVHSFGDDYSGLPGTYSNYSSGGFGPSRNSGGFGGRLGSYGGIGEFGAGYGRYYAGLGGYGGGSSFGYASRFGSYGGGGFGGAYTSEGLGGYRRGDESYGGFGGASLGGSDYNGAYDSGLGGYGSGGVPYSSRGSFTGGAGRYHPYGR